MADEDKKEEKQKKRRYRKILSVIQNDRKFRELSDKAQLVWFLLLTHPHMTSLGAMRGTAEGMCFEHGKWELEAFREAFREVLAKGLAKYDKNASLIYLPNYLKHNPPESPNVVKSWLYCFDDLPECDLKCLVIKRVTQLVGQMTEGFQEALREVFAKASLNQEQEAVTETATVEEAQKELFLGVDNSQANGRHGSESDGAEFIPIAEAWNSIEWLSSVHIPLAKGNLTVARKGWKHEDTREGLQDPDGLVKAINAQRSFLQKQSWFRFTWIFKGDTGGERNITKLMDYAYQSEEDTQPSFEEVIDAMDLSHLEDEE